MSDAPSKPTGVPEWAPFFKVQEYRDFVDRVTAELRTRPVQDLEIGNGVARFRHATGGQLSAGLQNLAQVCHQHPVDRWAEIIRDHFTLFEEIEADRLAFDRDARDLHKVQPLLKTRLCTNEALSVDDPTELITRPLGGGLVALLTFDRPSVVQSVSREQSDAWPITVDEAIKVGIENVRRNGPLPVREFALQGGGAMQALLSDDFFVSTHALFLGDYLSPEARHGALVAVPHRHAVLFHPIRDLSVLRVAEAMLLVAAGMFREGPGSLSPHIYWWQKGEWIPLPVEMEGERLSLTPPPEFLELLQILQPPEGDEGSDLPSLSEDPES